MDNECRKKNPDAATLTVLFVCFIFWLSTIIFVFAYLYNLDYYINYDPGQIENRVDFKCYYAIASMIGEGNSSIYDDRATVPYLLMAQLEKEPAGRVTYPPTFYFMMISMTSLPLVKSAEVWTFIKYPEILLTSVLLAFLMFKDRKEIWIRVLSTIFFAISIFAFSPTLDDIMCGQVSVHLLLILVFILYLLEKDMQIAAGILLGVVFCIKFISLLLILYLLIRKKWQAFFSSIITIALINLPVIILFGGGIYLDYFHSLPRNIELHLNYFNNSILSKLLYYAMMIQDIPSHQIQWVKIVSFTLSAAVIIATFYVIIRKKENGNLFQEFSLLITATVLISPITWSFHYSLLFIPIGYIFWQIVGETSDFKSKVPAIGILFFIYFVMAALTGIAGETQSSEFRLLFVKSGVPLCSVFILWIFLIYGRTMNFTRNAI